MKIIAQAVRNLRVQVFNVVSDNVRDKKRGGLDDYIWGTVYKEVCENTEKKTSSSINLIEEAIKN